MKVTHEKMQLPHESKRKSVVDLIMAQRALKSKRELFAEAREKIEKSKNYSALKFCLFHFLRSNTVVENV